MSTVESPRSRTGWWWALRRWLALLQEQAYERERVLFFEDNSSSRRLAIEATAGHDGITQATLRQELTTLIEMLAAQHQLRPARQAMGVDAEVEQLKRIQDATPRLL